jgi:hypothetical protein
MLIAVLPNVVIVSVVIMVAVILSVVMLGAMLSSYAECHYADCYYAGCRYAGCRSAVITQQEEVDLGNPLSFAPIFFFPQKTGIDVVKLRIFVIS